MCEFFCGILREIFGKFCEFGGFKNGFKGTGKWGFCEFFRFKNPAAQNLREFKCYFNTEKWGFCEFKTALIAAAQGFCEFKFAKTLNSRHFSDFAQSKVLNSRHFTNFARRKIKIHTLLTQQKIHANPHFLGTKAIFKAQNTAFSRLCDD